MLTVALLACALTAPGQVSAADAREAQLLANRSAREYDLGHAEDALRDIERAYLLDPRPGLLFNLGQCHRKLEHWKQAQEAYQGFLRYRPNAPNRETVLQLIEQMKLKLHPPPAPVTPAAAEPPAASAAPAGATATEVVVTQEEAPSHSHLLGGVLFAAAAVSAGFAIYGAVRVANWQSQAGGLGTPPIYGQYASLQNQLPNMNNWEFAASVLGGVAVAGVVAGIFTW